MQPWPSVRGEAILREMGHSDGSRAPVVVTVADSPDTRLFIELSSCGSDLTEARHALDLAVQGRQDGSGWLTQART